MTTGIGFDAQQAAHWFAQSCAYAELLGRIQGYLDANATPRFPITADETVQRIRAAVEQFNGGDAG